MRSIEESMEELEILQLMTKYFVALREVKRLAAKIEKKIRIQKLHKAAAEGRN